MIDIDSEHNSVERTGTALRHARCDGRRWSRLATLLLFLLPFSCAEPANAESVREAMPSSWRLSYEQLPIAPGQNMGISGLHADIHPVEAYPPFYAGAGVYGASSGREGGWFTLGYTAGVRYPVGETLRLDGGVFVGGGGGSALSFPGSGLMLRSHLLLEKEFGAFRLGGGLAHTDFPNTTNKSYAHHTHLALDIGYAMDSWRTAADGEDAAPFAGEERELRLAPVFLYYRVDRRPTKRLDRYPLQLSYQESFPQLGVRIERFIDDRLFTGVEAYGGGGSAIGWAMFQLCLGYSLPLNDYLRWENKMAVGLAGDGSIDTRGGLLVQPTTGVRIQPTDSFSLQAMIGRAVAPYGRLRATSYELASGWHGDLPLAEGKHRFSSDKYDMVPWEFAITHKSYFPDGKLRNEVNQPYASMLGLIGFEMGRPLLPWLGLIASTHWALQGNIGSYAEGLFGIRIAPGRENGLFTPVLSGEIGVAGGGKMNVGNGWIRQWSAGGDLHLAPDVAISLSLGRMQAIQNTFAANLALLTLRWQLATPFGKPEETAYQP